MVPRPVPEHKHQAYLDDCCHLIQPTTVTDIEEFVDFATFCGSRPRRDRHPASDPLALECPGCARPRCPECVEQWERGQA